MPDLLLNADGSPTARPLGDGRLDFRLADPSDVTTLYDIRQAAIHQLSLTHLSEREAAVWAERGGIPRVERAIAKAEVWVATLGLHVVGWLHLAANSIEGLYVSPPAARQGVGTALVRLAESRIAKSGYHLVALESIVNGSTTIERGPASAVTAVGDVFGTTTF